MNILLSSIGSRGDVQPLLALALELRALGHTPRLCVPPNFKAWVESFGIACLPIGPDLEKLTGGSRPATPPELTTSQRQQMARHAICGQFPVITEAAQGCDLILGAGVLQFAARSVAEAMKLPYVFAAYSPVALPSADHPPAKMGTHHSQSLPRIANFFLWKREARHWNALFGAPLNEARAKLGLPPVRDVQHHLFTDTPWLAADETLAPAARHPRFSVQQTGAWLLRDDTPLPAPLEAFLANGTPPVYFGLGSMRAAENASRVMIESARALGLRAIVLQGWGQLRAIDDGEDCFSIGEVNHERLLPRVALVVHHGGAGTTTAAARAGRAQVIVPHLYDQFYSAHRVRKLGLGTAVGQLTVPQLVSAMRGALGAEVSLRAQAIAQRIRTTGAADAAAGLVRHASVMPAA